MNESSNQAERKFKTQVMECPDCGSSMENVNEEFFPGEIVQELMCMQCDFECQEIYVHDITVEKSVE
jgi:hypothetical protein